MAIQLDTNRDDNDDGESLYSLEGGSAAMVTPDLHLMSDQLRLISQMLSKHDPRHVIAFQIDRQLKQDNLSLELLVKFDDISLQQTVNSWNLDTPLEQDSSTIRDLIINGIRNMKSSQNFKQRVRGSTSTSNSRHSYSNSNGININISKKNKKRDSVNIITENEMKMMQELLKYEYSVIDRISKFENENKEREMETKKLFTDYNNKLESIFDKLMEDIIQRKFLLFKKLTNIFENKNLIYEKHSDNLNKIKHEIENVKQEYNSNLKKMNEMGDISQRSNVNCTMIDALINDSKNKYILETEYNTIKNIDYDQCSISFNNQILTEIEEKISNLGQVEDLSNLFNINQTGIGIDSYRYSQGDNQLNLGMDLSKQKGGNKNKLSVKNKNKNSDISSDSNGNRRFTFNAFFEDNGLSNIFSSDNNNGNNNTNKKKKEVVSKTSIIDKPTVFESNKIHKFDILKIVKGGSITVQPFNCKTNKEGGILRINCSTLILESGSEINVTGKGYQGGINIGYQGYSYNENGNLLIKQSISTNYGGGGGSKVFGYGGGGGYGTKGNDGGDNNFAGKGGNVYGNSQLTNVYLGSGGGACGMFGYCGGSGGGAIVIKCTNGILIEKNAIIVANGQSIDDENCGGCGSGGSIYLKASKIVNKGSISAIGGVNKKSKYKEGNGGDGRIRIDCDKKNKKFLQMKNIFPKAGHLELT